MTWNAVNATRSALTSTLVKCFRAVLFNQREKSSTEPTPSSTSVRFSFSFHSLPGRFFSPLLSTSESLGLRGDPPISDSASPPRIRNPPKTTTAADLCVQDKGIIEGPLLNSHTHRTTEKRKLRDSVNQHLLESSRLFGWKSARSPLLRLRVLCCRLKGASEARCCTVCSSVPLQQAPSSS